MSAVADDLLAGLDAEARALVRERAQPRWTEPMLATLVHEPFSDAGWVFERKLDGVRALAFKTPAGVRLRSRRDQDLNGTFPELVEALERQPAERFVADGEVVAFEGARTSFARLQGRLGVSDPRKARRSGVAVRYYAFDLLHLEGRDVTRVPLRARKALCKRALDFAEPLRFTAHRNAAGERLLEDACRRGWEGLIAKDAASAYVHRRSRAWLKLKCDARQELVVVGWTEPRGSRAGLGALLVGVWAGGELRYAGKVGTGFDAATLRALAARLARLERARPTVVDPPRAARGVHWAAPELVAEVAFTEWTRAGRLRHPRFLGLRTDKDPRAVVREGGGG